MGVEILRADRHDGANEVEERTNDKQIRLYRVSQGYSMYANTATRHDGGFVTETSRLPLGWRCGSGCLIVEVQSRVELNEWMHGTTLHFGVWSAA